jgi:hypothetical protein
MRPAGILTPGPARPVVPRGYEAYADIITQTLPRTQEETDVARQSLFDKMKQDYESRKRNQQTQLIWPQ